MSEIFAHLFYFRWSIAHYLSLFIRYWLYLPRIHKIENSWEEHDEDKVNNNHQDY
ncbi:hypothetical protein [Chryseobacterium sp. BIGb0232]|uniref:hypothetical protein n=1 Tax=Chryseobacterium sp. BIGb0232 TaxID=2940598 RepID=UPI000FBEF732|nr:hypothetical protein [Chryseobacterium sp. BIGb0232]MCS4302226.1 hypothetical protein [Chryseobacterium sp. BIGb0232]ROS18171.1 hypothetical protein EDF65_2563 [Chryseobacterium nakagawai]